MTDRQSALIDVRVLLVRESQILLLQRSDALFPGWWNLPGGHVVAAENAMQAALRELKEETAVTVLPHDLHFSAVGHYELPSRGVKIGFAFMATSWSGIPRIAEPHKFSAIEWHPVDKLPNALMPHSAEVIRLHRSGVAFSAYGWNEPTQVSNEV